MLPAVPAPNLYTHFTLDHRATSRELGVQLAAADARLEGIGYLPEDHERQELAVAARILTEPSFRATYDQGVEGGYRPTWGQLEEFAETGRWAPQQHAVFSYPAGATAQGSDDSRRASPANRASMAIADYVIATFAVSIMVSSGLSGLDAGGVLTLSLTGVGLVAYYLLFEVLVGATPAKLIAGYTVRDANTHQKLSWQQSIKRNWWRVVSLVPGLGPLMSFFAALYYVTTISPTNALRGQHDILANAEVVKK